MQLRRLGRTNVNVSSVGMGTWKTFDVKGTEIEQARHQVLHAALEAGATFLDSSPMYGEAERVLGEALCNDRKRAFLATKVWTATGRYNADEQIAKALLYFGGIIDLYQVHNLSETEMVLDKLEKLRDNGQTRFLGITHYREDAFEDMMRWMRTGRIDTIQVPYNALRTQAAEEILPLAKELDLGVIIMEPLGSGKLVNLPVPQQELEYFSKYKCTTWAQVLLKWLLSDENVHVVIPATSKPERMRENALAGDAPFFTEEDRKRVEDLARKYSG